MGIVCLLLFCGAVIVLFISSRVKRVEISCIAGCGIMLLPLLLYAYVGIEMFRPFAYITSVEAVPLLTRANGDAAQFLLWGAALIIIVGAAVAWLFAEDIK